MASRVKITESEILEEMRESLNIEERQPGYMSIPEMAAALDCSTATVFNRVAKWKREGKVESLRVRSMRSDGRSQVVTVFKLKRLG